MNKKRTLFFGVLVALILVIAIVSCAPETVEVEKVVTQIVKEQVTVMVEGTSVVKEVEVEVVVTATPSAPVEIEYTYGGSGVPNDLEMVQDAINEILIPKINVKLILNPMDYGTFGERMQLKMAAGEECDIVFTAPWINNYSLNVINGALYPLDDLLPEYAPGLWASISPSTWEAARVKGYIYGVINQQIWPKPWGVHVIKEYADKYNLDLNDIQTWEDMEPFNDAILAGEGGEVTPYCKRSIPFYMQYAGFAEFGPSISTQYDDPTVVNVVESQQWQDLAKLNRKWYLAGYVFQDDVPNLDETIKANLCAWDSHVEKPNQGTDLKARYGQDWIFKSLTDPLILDTGGATATMNAICATSQNPEAAMKVLEMLNTNKEVYRLISYGIEGLHWEWVDKDLDVVSTAGGKTASELGYWPNTDWMFGNQFNAPYRDIETAKIDAWEQTRRLNNSAVPHILLGLTFDVKPVENEAAQVNAVLAEFCAPVLSGLVEFEGNYEICVEKMKDAGIDALIAEGQRQVDEFMANK
ncbi:MAG: ABC transporter substrate-binding protein [Anaerolineae bacterium]|nr:ABC transporter substrate-binding protein [Anaerolineae bacterium]